MTTDLPAWAAELLRDARVGRLATADRVGRPLVMPACYVFADGTCYSPVDAKPKRLPARRIRRLRNLAENPQAALVVDRWDEDWRRLAWVLVEGPADLVDDGPERARAAGALLVKYPQYRALGGEAAFAAIIRLRAVRVRAWRWE